MAKAKPYRRLLSHGFVETVRPRDGREEDLVWDWDAPGLCLRIRRSGSKSYKVAYQHQGKTRWYTIGSTKIVGLAKARERAREIREEAADGKKDPQGEKVEGRKGDTLKHFHEEYLEKKARGANKSWKQGAALMDKHVLRKLGRKKLKEITRRDMWEIFDSLYDRPVLANAVMNAASAVFTWAFKREYIDRNPCQGIERHSTTTRKRFLSNDEIRLVWPMFEALSLPGTIFKLVLLTAQRPGEVRHMRWEHIDLGAALWSMPGAPSPVWPGTKNGRDHEVPLTKPVLELLHELDPQPEGPVFPGTHRGRDKPIYGVSTRELCKKGGLVGDKKFNPHDLRATAATGMDALGITRQHISLVLNHMEGGTTAGYVRHGHREHRRRALEAWAAELMLVLEGKGHTDQKAEIVPLERREVG